MMLQIKLREKLDIIVFVLFAALLAGGMVSANSLAVRPASTDEESSMSQLWNIETVDAPWVQPARTSLALDTEGNPHISYYGNNNDLLYARWSGSEWRIQVVDGSEMGRFSSLALDSDDDPHISYYSDRPKSDLRYAHWRHSATGDAWHTQTVDATGDVGAFTSLALDTNGNPHISYADYTVGSQKYGDLKYAHWVGRWEIQTVDNEGIVGGSTSLDLDANDRPHISYVDGSTDALKYARWMGNAWEIETVGGAGKVRTTSLALDTEGHPHISYVATTNGALKYARWTGSNWFIETADITGSSCTASLALDGNDYPHISYCWDWGGLKYTRWTGSSWWTQNVDNSRNWYNSLALDAENIPHISYVDLKSDALKYARLEPPRLTLTKQATPSQGLRNIDALTYTLTLSSAGYSVRLWDPLPDAVRYITGSLDSSVVPAAVYSPTAHAIIWHGTLPDSLQEIRFQVTPKVTGAVSHSLSLPILNTAWLTVKRSGVTIRADVMVNGQHIYLPLMIEGR